MSHSASVASPRPSELYEAGEPSSPAPAASAPRRAHTRDGKLSNSGPVSSGWAFQGAKSPHALHQLLSATSSGSYAQPQATQAPTSARSELNTPNGSQHGAFFARAGRPAFETSSAQGPTQVQHPARLGIGSSRSEATGGAANSSLASKSAESAVFVRALGLQSNSLPNLNGTDTSSLNSEIIRADLPGAAASGPVARLDFTPAEHGSATAIRPQAPSSGSTPRSGDSTDRHSLNYTSESSGAQDSQRTEVAVVQPSSTAHAQADADRMSTGHSSSLLSTSLPSDFMVTMDGSQTALRQPGSTNAPHPDLTATSGAGHAGGVGNAEDPHDDPPAASSAAEHAGAAYAKAATAGADQANSTHDVPMPAPVGLADGDEQAQKQTQPAASMKHGFEGGMRSRDGHGVGGESTVRFADEEQSQPSSKGTTALLKDSSDGERNPSYMTNCRMQMLIMEEPPQGASSADYVCYLRNSMDGMRAELHAVMEQAHKAQAWMKRRERLMQLQQGLLVPTTDDVFVFSAPWARLRARFEGLSRSVSWSGLPEAYSYLRAKAADVVLLDEAATELFKVIWRRASTRSHADIEVEMKLQPAIDSSVGTAVASAVPGVIHSSRVNVPSSVSGSCLGCFSFSAEGGAAGRSATYDIHHSDEDMMDDSYGQLGMQSTEVQLGQWFRFVLVVRFVDKGPSAHSQGGAMAPMGSGRDSDNAIDNMQQQLEGNSVDAFPLNDDEYVGVEVAREVARLHGGQLTFEFLPGRSPTSSSSMHRNARESGITQAVFSVFARRCNPLEAMANQMSALGSSEEDTQNESTGAAAPSISRAATAAGVAEEGSGRSESKATPGPAAQTPLPNAGDVPAAAAQLGGRSNTSHQLNSARLEDMFLEQIAAALHPNVRVREGPMQGLHPSVDPLSLEEGALDRPRVVQVDLHGANFAADDPTAGAAAAHEAQCAADRLLYAGSSPRAGVATAGAAEGYQISVGKRQWSVEVLAGTEGGLRPPEELMEVTVIDLASKARALEAVTAASMVQCRKFHPTDCRHHVLVVTPRKTTAEALVHILGKLPSVCSYAVASTTAELERQVLAPCSKGIPLPTAVFVTSQLGQAHADVLAYFLRRNGLLSASIAVAMPGEEEKLLQLFPQVMRSPCLASDVSASLLQIRYE